MEHSDQAVQGADRSDQLALTRQLVDLSAQRSEFSAERTYMNAERTLSVWARTSLALMIFGLAIDRFGLLLRRMPALQMRRQISPDALSAWGGVAMVSVGVLMVIACGLRFVMYARAFRRRHRPPEYHGPYLAASFAALVAIFGIALLAVLLVFAD